MIVKCQNKYFAEYTGIEVKQFRETLLQHMSNVKKSVAERIPLDVDLVVMEISGTESGKQDTSSKSGNDTDTNDADIKPIYDEKPMAELCLDHEVKDGDKVVKKELIFALRGEIYFVKFVINPEEDDIELGVILGRSFMRLTKGIADFRNGIITIYPELDPFIENSEETKKSEDYWELIPDGINFGDIPKIDGLYLPPLVCKMGKSEEATREEIAIDIYKRFSILEEARLVIKTMTYIDRYKKILDSILAEKIKLDGEIRKEEEEAITKVMGEAFKEKKDPGAFVIPNRLEEKINLNALADTEPMGLLKDLLCQVGVTTIIVKFLILDMHVDKEVPILVGRGFLATCGSILNTRDKVTSTFEGICHHTFRAAKTSVNTKESDNDNEEEYIIKRNSFGALVYGAKSSKYLNCTNLMDRALTLQEVLNPFRKICVWKKVIVLNNMVCAEEIKSMLEIKVYETRSQEEIFSSEEWRRVFDINEPIYTELCHEFYSTYDFNEVCANDELRTKKVIKFRLCVHAHSLTLLEFT
ncbi:hypothetical protein Tco_0885508 [Tanacetum coccineum]